MAAWTGHWNYCAHNQFWTIFRCSTWGSFVTKQAHFYKLESWGLGFVDIIEMIFGCYVKSLSLSLSLSLSPSLSLSLSLTHTHAASMISKTRKTDVTYLITYKSLLVDDAKKSIFRANLVVTKDELVLVGQEETYDLLKLTLLKCTQKAAFLKRSWPFSGSIHSRKKFVSLG